MTGQFDWDRAEMQRAAAHLEKHIKGCWVCGQNDWLISQIKMGEKPYDPDAHYLAIADQQPKLRITCKVCGNIGYFSTEVIGISQTDGGEG